MPIAPRVKPAAQKAAEQLAAEHFDSAAHNFAGLLNIKDPLMQTPYTQGANALVCLAPSRGEGSRIEPPNAKYSVGCNALTKQLC